MKGMENCVRIFNNIHICSFFSTWHWRLLSTALKEVVIRCTGRVLQLLWKGLGYDVLTAVVEIYLLWKQAGCHYWHCERSAMAYSIKIFCFNGPAIIVLLQQTTHKKTPKTTRQNSFKKTLYFRPFTWAFSSQSIHWTQVLMICIFS